MGIIAVLGGAWNTIKETSARLLSLSLLGAKPSEVPSVPVHEVCLRMTLHSYLKLQLYYNDTTGTWIKINADEFFFYQIHNANVYRTAFTYCSIIPAFILERINDVYSLTQLSTFINMSVYCISSSIYMDHIYYILYDPCLYIIYMIVMWLVLIHNTCRTVSMI